MNCGVRGGCWGKFEEMRECKMTCPKCKAQLPATAISCSTCGTKFKSKTCPQCGAQVLSTTVKCPHCGKSTNEAPLPVARPAQTSLPAAPYLAPNTRVFHAPLRTWKLVSGILSIVLSLLVVFQSCAAGLANTLSNNGEVSGSAGAVVAVMLLAGALYPSRCVTASEMAVILPLSSCMAWGR